jgi:acetyl-CoA synthetase
VIFEGTPFYPDNDRYWKIIDQYKVNQFYTAPTAIRSLMKFGEEPVMRHSLKTLKVLGSVGEPINPEAWVWYYRVVGKENCSIVDTFWQTETGNRSVAFISSFNSIIIQFNMLQVDMLSQVYRLQHP